MPRIKSLELMTVIFIISWPHANTLGGSPRGTVHVGPNVQVSTARSKLEHFEVVVAADPENASALLAGSKLWYSQALAEKDLPNCVVYRSSDGGKTWGICVDDRAHWATDPTLAFGPNSAAYFGCMQLVPPLQVVQKQNGMPIEFGSSAPGLVYRSTDGGKNWSEPVPVDSADRSFIDRPWICVDWTDGENRGRLYWNSCIRLDAAWHTGGNLFGNLLTFSADHGRTFPPIGVYQVQLFDLGLKPHGSGNAVVLPDGSVAAAWVISLKARQLLNPNLQADRTADGNTTWYWVSVDRSTDGGKTIGTWIKDRLTVDHKIAAKPLGDRRPVPTPGLAVSSGTKHRGRLYLVWDDFLESGARVAIARSDDRGQTWSKPTVISDIAQGKEASRPSDAFMPWVAVNPAGDVGVCWYDTRHVQPGKEGWDVHFALSQDGGESWTPSVRVSETTSLSEHRASLAFIDVGDTLGLTAGADGRFHVVWVDKRTGCRQVWTASISVNNGQ